MIAGERIPFAGAPSLVAFGVTVLAVMAVVFPKRGEFASVAQFDGQPDAFSIAYLEALVRSSPQDARGPVLQYSRSLASVGRYSEALGWLGNLPSDSAADDLRLDVRAEYARSLTPEDPRRSGLVEAIEKGLSERAKEPLGPERGERLAKVALEWGWPSLAASFYRELAHSDPPKRADWLREAARWYLASNDPRAAAECYKLAAAIAQDYQSLEHDGLAAVDATEATGDAKAAYRLAESYTMRLPGSAPILRRAASLAVSAGQPDAAKQMGRLLVASGGATDEDLRTQMNREIVAGEVGNALDLAKELVNRHPNDLHLRRLEAHLAEQVGDDALALRDWTRLAQ